MGLTDLEMANGVEYDETFDERVFNIEYEVSLNKIRLYVKKEKEGNLIDSQIHIYNAIYKFIINSVISSIDWRYGCILNWNSIESSDPVRQ